jgi:hypothetical protein
MAMARSIAASFALKQTATRRFITLFALLAFFLHGVSIQSHLHPAIAPPSAMAAVGDLPAPLKKTDTTDHCRPCQEIAQAGVFLAPTASAIPASLGLVTAAFVTLPLLSGAIAPAFAWQSRAPPRH